jgi:hypothetical protein
MKRLGVFRLEEEEKERKGRHLIIPMYFSHVGISISPFIIVAFCNYNQPPHFLMTRMT